MLGIPEAPESPNIAALAMWRRERFTGSTSTTITLARPPRRTLNDEGVELVFMYDDSAAAWKWLDPNGGANGYAIVGAEITLGAAPQAADIFLVLYPYRET